MSFADAAFGGLSWRDAAVYLPAQVAGCIAGAVTANLMFALPAVTISAKHRASGAHFLSEVIATAGLLLVIFSLARSGRARAAPAAVGAYIGAAYWFTSSTSFANPAITVGRMFSDTFAGIAPSSVPSFIGAQSSAGWPPSRSSRSCTPRSPRRTPLASSFPAAMTRPGPWSGACVMAEIPEVLFVCTHNAGRSQMAAALLNQQAAGQVRVTSAGSQPPAD